jgi:hypothetical protein
MPRACFARDGLEDTIHPLCRIVVEWLVDTSDSTGRLTLPEASAEAIISFVYYKERGIR